MKIGRIGSFTISQEGKALEDEGEGIVWSCTCPLGIAYAADQWSRLRGGPYLKLRPCRHLFSVFAAAKEGFIADRLRLTPAGRIAADKCSCIERAGGLQPRPMKNALPAQASGQMSKDGPCPCGSGFKMKRCAKPGSPHHEEHLRRTRPTGPGVPPKWKEPRCGAFGPAGEGPCIHRAGHVERGYAIHRDEDDRYWSGKPKKRGWFAPTVAWIKAEKARLEERSRQLDDILDRIRAKEEARAERARVRRAERKAAKR